LVTNYLAKPNKHDFIFIKPIKIKSTHSHIHEIRNRAHHRPLHS